MSEIITIAIDGPAGAGKSSVSDQLAKQLNILHLDTGALYRACALACVQANISRNDKEAILEIVKEAEVSVDFKNDKQITLLNGENVNHLIRTPEVSTWASDVSALQEVRIKLLDLQRDLSKSMSMVVDGRDIASNVLPDAKYKIYLDATAEIRALRRFNELKDKNPDLTYEAVLKEQKYRDEQDKNREFAPLIIAEDAHYIESSDMTIQDTVDAILEYMTSIE